MKRVFIFFLLCSILFVHPSSVSAANPVKPAQAWSCLSISDPAVAEAIANGHAPDGATKIPVVGKCAANTDCLIVTKITKNTCRREPKTRGGTELKCDAVPGSAKWTTGTLEGDKLLFGKDSRFSQAARLETGSSVKPGVVKTNVVITTKSKEDSHQTNLELYAVGVNKATGGGGIKGAPKNGASFTLQQGLLAYEKVKAKPPKGLAKDCVKIMWDPYGYVFDATSLEPLDNATVTMLDKTATTPISLPDNPAFTNPFGKYNILAEKDDYYTIKAEIPSHSFKRTSFDAIKYKQIYWNNPEDVTTAEHNVPIVFQPGDKPFYEEYKRPARVDIALAPLSIPYYRSTPIKHEGRPDALRQFLDDGNEYMMYTGAIDFPHGMVPFLHEDGSLMVLDGEPVIAESDTQGEWRMALSIDSVGTQTIILGEPYKNPLLYNSKTPTSFTKTAFRFEPILQTIEGYAYDSDNRAIANADVNIILKMNGVVAYSTKADASGAFTIATENLPVMDYSLEFINPITKKTTSRTTSTFAKENADYVAKKNISLVDKSEVVEKVDDNTSNNTNTIPNRRQQSELVQQNVQATPKNLGPVQSIAIIVVVLLALIGITIGVFIFMKKRSTPPAEY